MNFKQTNSNNRSMIPLIMIGVGFLLIAGVLVWILSRPNSGTAANSQNIPYPEVKRASLDEVKTAYDQKQATFVDVRPEASYQEGHIPGSINIPLTDLQNQLSKLDPNAWIIPYCT